MAPRTDCTVVLGAVALGIMILSGCAHRKLIEPVASPAEMANKECQFVKKELVGNPDDLVKDYLTRDAAGEFTIASAWFDNASLCPGHEGGPELVYVVKDFRVESAKTDQMRSTATVTYHLIGMLEPGAEQSWHFNKKKKTLKRTFRFVHTAYGWRFRDIHLADGQYLSAESALKRVSTVKDKKVIRLESRRKTKRKG